MLAKILNRLTTLILLRAGKIPYGRCLDIGYGKAMRRGCGQRGWSLPVALALITIRSSSHVRPRSPGIGIGFKLVGPTRCAWSDIACLACASHLLGSTGGNKKVEQWSREGLLRDPVASSLQSELGCNAYYAGQFERAIREFRSVLQIEPNHLVSLWGMARAQAQSGQSEEALGTLNAAPPLPMILAEKGYVYAKVGRAEDAKRILAELHEQSKHHFFDPYQSAVVYLAMGDLERVFEQLTLASNVKSPFLISIPSDPKWTKQLGDPRMIAFLERAGVSRN